MPRPGLTWQNAQIPANTAFFAIGDIHAQHEMLETLLHGIGEEVAKIRTKNPDCKIYVVGIGDYIDRGSNAPKTIDTLLKFKREMAPVNVETVLLCGNHDEYFKRVLDAKAIVGEGPNNDPFNNRHSTTRPDGTLSLQGLINWLDKGGGLTTLRDYNIVENPEKFLESAKTSPDMTEINRVIHALQQKIPASHRAFFDETYQHNHLILGDFLFTHAGIDPNKTLSEQGIGEDRIPNPAEKLELVNPQDRDKFLWTDKLDKCPYIVVHGHTPSAIVDKSADKGNAMVVADPQKGHRISLDTNVYGEKGALTCMARAGNDTKFMAVSRQDPSYVSEYAMLPDSALRAAQYQMTHAPKHPMEYKLRNSVSQAL